MSDQSERALRGDARTGYREGIIPVGLMRCLTIPLGDCDAENIAPFGMPANFEHDRFLQCLEAPACPDALGPRAPMVEQAAQRTPDGDRKNSETDKPNRRLTPNTDIAGLV